MTKTITFLGRMVLLPLVLFGCETAGRPVGPEFPAGHMPGSNAAGALLHVHLDDYPLVYEEPETFVLQVSFENRGDTPILVLPSSIHRQYQPLADGRVTYRPFPGPRVSPWEHAVAIQPRQFHIVTLTGMQDGDGLWTLEPGTYRLSVRYLVTPDLANGAGVEKEQASAPDGDIWVGELQTREVTLRYEPASLARREPPDLPAPALGLGSN